MSNASGSMSSSSTCLLTRSSQKAVSLAMWTFFEPPVAATAMGMGVGSGTTGFAMCSPPSFGVCGLEFGLEWEPDCELSVEWLRDREWCRLRFLLCRLLDLKQAKQARLAILTCSWSHKAHLDLLPRLLGEWDRECLLHECLCLERDRDLEQQWYRDTIILCTRKV